MLARGRRIISCFRWTTSVSTTLESKKPVRPNTRAVAATSSAGNFHLRHPRKVRIMTRIIPHLRRPPTLPIANPVIAPNILTEGRREKEKEMIWRGKQYTRGVKLYYRKMGRFPTKLDDLTKPKLGSLRFMRQAYKDPMNKEDGSWRFIYVGPAGQLIGSLKPPQQNLTLPQAGAIGTPANDLNAPNAPAQPGAIGQPGPGRTQ